MSNSSTSVGKWLVPFLSLFVFVMAAGSAAASTYYVSNSGNNSNSGTSPTSPWQTISKVQSILPSLQPGDSVLFERGGIWYEQLDLNNVNGNSGSPITFSNYGSGPLPVIEGGSSRDYCIDAISPAIVSYLVIDGFECRNTKRQAITFETGVGMPGIVVKNSYIHNTGPGACAGCGTPFDDSNYNNQLEYRNWNLIADGAQFLNNTVKNCGGHNCVQVHGDMGGPVIQGNIVGPGCVHNCIDVKEVLNAFVANNTVTCPTGCPDPATAAFYIENTQAPAASVTYQNNVAYDVSIGFQADSGGPCDPSVMGTCAITAKYYNNTVNNASRWPFIYTSGRSIDSFDIRNNIFHGSEYVMSPGPSVTENHNDCYGGAVCTGASDLSVDPQFVNAAAHDFHLQSTSPVIDQGTNVGLPFNGSAPDMGAFESGGTSGPVAWYKLDETSGTAALDSSGNGNNSSFVQGTSIVSGKINNARSFNARTTSDYINIPTSPSLSGLNQFTVAFWIKTNSLNSTAYQTALFEKGDYQISGVQILDDGPYSALVVCRTDYAGGSNDVSIPRNSINDGAWHHLACTFDGVTKTFYLDGNALSIGGVSGYVSPDNYDLHLGTPWNNNSSAVVIEDDVRIYNRALNATEIQALVNP